MNHRKPPHADRANEFPATAVPAATGVRDAPGAPDAISGTAAPPDYADEIQRAWDRERPGTPTASIGVITRIWGAGKILEDERRRTLARLGIDAATLDLLSTLRRAGEPYRLTAGEIAKRTLVSAGAISQRVARAEREGLVTRQRSGTDGRHSYVTLTEAGHALIERSVDGLLRYEESLLSALTADQRGTLSDLLRILLADLSSHPSRPGHSSRPGRDLPRETRLGMEGG